MNVIRFKRGVKHWECTYEVKIDYEYTADLGKKISDIIFYQPQTNLRVRVPWKILKNYLNGDLSTTYVDESGLKLEMDGKDLRISDSRLFHIKVHEDQRKCIHIAAIKVKEDISSSVERILRESASISSPPIK